MVLKPYYSFGQQSRHISNQCSKNKMLIECLNVLGIISPHKIPIMLVLSFVGKEKADELSSREEATHMLKLRRFCGMSICLNKIGLAIDRYADYAAKKRKLQIIYYIGM